jgi:hypothetical protein
MADDHFVDHSRVHRATCQCSSRRDRAKFGRMQVTKCASIPANRRPRRADDDHVVFGHRDHYILASGQGSVTVPHRIPVAVALPGRTTAQATEEGSLLF